jgi:hypothetical protein
MFWCRPWLLERIADLDIGDEHFEPEAGQYDATTAHALERLIGIYSQVAGMEIVEAMDVSGRLKEYRKNPVTRPNIYAFYLPQYHQIPENDEFWGEGFTDWDNVKKAKPLFEGHRQPILPSEEVGFYDLKDPEVLRKQAKMAKDHGIDGFVMHYYWFDGKKVLDTPLNNWLNDPNIDLPLALCWANEPWTRRWDGLENDVLLDQNLTNGWVDRFYEDIAHVLADPRYIRVDGVPLLIVYRMGLMPEAASAVARWRARAEADGLPGLHIVAVLPSRDFERFGDIPTHAVDAVVTFPPGSGIRLEQVPTKLGGVPRQSSGSGYLLNQAFSGIVDHEVGGLKPAVTIMPGWDNTARRPQGPHYFVGSNAVTWAGVMRTRLAGGVSRLGPAAFVNAWNEWAEGAQLEPSLRFGHGRLASVADVRSVEPTRATETES